MVEIKNPGHISTLTKTAGLPGTKVVDSTDFIHTGLIKSLNQMSRGNYAIGNGTASSDMGFKMTMTDNGSGKTKVEVTEGRIFRDGAKYTVAAKTGGSAFVAGTTPSTFDVPSSAGVSYFLLVADSSNVLQIRGNKTIKNKVPDFNDGDTIIALIKMDTTDTSVAARYVQYFTTDKTSNSLSIGYDNSNVYTEVSAITGTASGLFISGAINSSKPGKILFKSIINVSWDSFIFSLIFSS